MSFKTADLSDNHPDQVSILSPGLQVYGGAKTFWGEVVTVRVLEDNVLVRKALSEDGHGKVLVVDGGGSPKCALIGVCMAKLASEKGWAGVVIYGYIRDTKELQDFDFGVRALGSHPKRSRKAGVGEIRTPVEFLGTKIKTGQFIYADQDGVLVSDEKLALE